MDKDSNLHISQRLGQAGEVCHCHTGQDHHRSTCFSDVTITNKTCPRGGGCGLVGGGEGAGERDQPGADARPDHGACAHGRWQLMCGPGGRRAALALLESDMTGLGNRAQPPVLVGGGAGGLPGTVLIALVSPECTNGLTTPV